MKPYTAPTENNKTDRIEKAIAIIEQGRIWQRIEGVFCVFTERMNLPYTVTINSCDCADFEQRQANDPTPCKHQWAAIGSTAALLICDIRKAQSLTTLQAVDKTYADAMSLLPDAFISVARKEYKARQCELTAQSHDDEALQILIKPQPKSNGNYNGIEI